MKFTGRVYISGPLTVGDTYTNLARAIQAAEVVWKLGYAPYVPHLNHFWDQIVPHSYEDWLALDKEWILGCDMLYRLKGESPGAAVEEEFARAFGIPVIKEENL